MPTKLANVQVHPQFRHRLRELRERAGLSLRALGALSNYSHSYLHDLERGVKQPTADTAARLDGALSADGQLTTLVTSQLATLAPPAPPVVDARYGVDAGLRFAPDWHQGIDNATGLWRWNARGRGVLRDVGFSAALFITPAMRWLTSPSGEQPTGTGDRLVGPPDIDAIAGADGET
ncbi:MAG: helix-turn-helix domain-containing protein [Actinobacteria bacterium]|nr:MAG: helix-turn-helix domain-containing protein [Actinomycetota bacterium]